jgi:hypothetical protein
MSDIMLTTVLLQIDAIGTSRKFYATYDGVAYALCSVPFANGVPVSASDPLPVSVVTGLRYKASVNQLVGVTSGILVEAGQYERVLHIQTLPGSTGRIYLRLDGSRSEPRTGLMIDANGGSISFGMHGLPMPHRAIHAVTDDEVPQEVLISGG